MEMDTDFTITIAPREPVSFGAPKFVHSYKHEGRKTDVQVLPGTRISENDTVCLMVNPEGKTYWRIIFLNTDPYYQEVQDALKGIENEVATARQLLEIFDRATTHLQRNAFPRSLQISQGVPYTGEQEKRGRGRPRKHPLGPIDPVTGELIKRGRGRPRKDGIQGVPETGLASDAVTEKRGRGRPRKDGLPVGTVVETEPRGRGRPRKSAVEGVPETGLRGRGRPRKDGLPVGSVTLDASAEKRGRGRPRKSAVEGVPETGLAAGEKRGRGRPRKQIQVVEEVVPENSLSRLSMNEALDLLEVTYRETEEQLLRQGFEPIETNTPWESKTLLYQKGDDTLTIRREADLPNWSVFPVEDVPAGYEFMYSISQ